MRSFTGDKKMRPSGISLRTNRAHFIIVHLYLYSIFNSISASGTPSPLITLAVKLVHLISSVLPQRVDLLQAFPAIYYISPKRLAQNRQLVERDQRYPHLYR